MAFVAGEMFGEHAGGQNRCAHVRHDTSDKEFVNRRPRRKPLVEKLERFMKFKPQRPLREIIRLTAAS
jgi:hypothetical protein